MTHLTFLDQVFDRTGDVLDGYLGVDAVLVEQIDPIGPEALEGSDGDLTDVLRATVQSFADASVRETEFRRDHHLIANRCQRLSEQFLIDEGAIRFGSVEESHAPLDRATDQCNTLRLVDRRTEAIAQPHAAQTDRRDFQITCSKPALLHGNSYGLDPRMGEIRAASRLWPAARVRRSDATPPRAFSVARSRVQ